MNILKIMTIGVTALGFSSCKSSTTQAEGSTPQQEGQLSQEVAEPAVQAEQPNEESTKPAAEEQKKGPESSTTFTAEQIKVALNAHIATTTKGTAGVFNLRDEQTGKDLSLKLVKIHDLVRKVEGRGYLTSADFHPTNTEEGKLYDLVFWLQPRDDKLVVTETQVYKHPTRQGTQWVQEERFTLEGNAVEIN